MTASGDLDQRAVDLQRAIERARLRIAQLRRDIAEHPRMDLGMVVAGGSDSKQLAIELDALRMELAQSRREFAERTRAAAESEQELQMQVDALRHKLDATEQRADAAESHAHLRVSDATTDAPAQDRRRLEAELKAAFETIDALQKAAQAKVEQFSEMHAQFQAQYFELEQLRQSKTNLQALLDEWRQRARDAERERDRLRQQTENATGTAERLSADAKRGEGRIRDLEAMVADLKRELALAEKRTEHLRQHLRAPR